MGPELESHDLATVPRPRTEADALLAALRALASAHDLPSVMTIVRRAARELTRADGVTFVLREGPMVHYADEDAIAPLWKGRRFPATACISGWAMINRESVVIEDIYADGRIPHDAYRSTFVIFGRFERACSAASHGGLGLGLWMARAIAEAHGGAISVESSPGAGATFTLVVPKRLPVES